ncbi:hypothetical protein FACS189425_06030 [Clostridia bacterium]|nr:hypothetical protein FACS189425_06030 [Clostridia bacterium]
MLCPVGKFLQNLRTERDEKSKEMAEKLGVIPVFMSAVSNGRQRCPDSWFDKVPELYALDESKRKEWVGAFIQTNHNINFLYEKLNDDDKNLVMTLTNFVDTMQPAHKKAIWEAINNGW